MFFYKNNKSKTKINNEFSFLLIGLVIMIIILVVVIKNCKQNDESFQNLKHQIKLSNYNVNHYQNDRLIPLKS